MLDYQGSLFTRKPVSMPDAIIANPIGTAKSQEDYTAAKAGDIDAAHRAASKLVTPDLIKKLGKQIEGQAPIVAAVTAEESTGRNMLPEAAAHAIATRLGLEHDENIVQSTSSKRTKKDGLDRIFSSPEFSGKVEPGRGYVLVDDTLTQGATFAALASHIEAAGGHISAVVALTGKGYSAMITPTPETIEKLRALHAEIEPQFQAATGYGFDGLTQSEARYLTNYRPLESVRNRVAAAVQEAGNCSIQGTGQGKVDDCGAPADHHK